MSLKEKVRKFTCLNLTLDREKILVLEFETSAWPSYGFWPKFMFCGPKILRIKFKVLLSWSWMYHTEENGINRCKSSFATSVSGGRVPSL